MKTKDLLELVVGDVDKWLVEAQHRRVAPEISYEAAVSIFNKPVPLQGTGEEQVIAQLAKDARAGLNVMNSPRFFGWVIGGVQPVSLAADWLVSAWDQNVCMPDATPSMVAIEEVTTRWILELLNLPPHSSVGFVTGGQMANVVCLAAAREAVLRTHDWQVGRAGLLGAPVVTVVVGEGRHHTIDRAVRFLGLGDRSLKFVSTDAQQRMDVAHLRDQLSRIEGAVIICAQSGQVNTGAFDPLAEIVNVVQERRQKRNRNDVWLHVDGSIGLWARTSERFSDAMRECEAADSWSTDAHKWLNTPYDCGIAICRDPKAHSAAMTMEGEYLNAPTQRKPVHWAPELSRRARAVPVYATIRHLGKHGIASMIERCCDMAAQFADRFDSVPGVRVLNDVTLNQVLVEFRDPQTGMNVTSEVIDAVQQEGVCYPTSTVWDGEPAMRISVCNWQTSLEDVDVSVASMLACHKLAST